MGSSQNLKPDALPAKKISIGLAAIVIVLTITTLIIASFDVVYFMEYVALAFMAATVTQIILGLFWHNNYPQSIGRLDQPLQGLCFTLITMIAGAAITAIMLVTVGAGHGSSPMLIQYAVMSIVVVLVLVPLWQCWPFTLLTKNPLFVGLLALPGSYVLAYALWAMFFDYGALGKISHPHYYADIDPGGLFDMWTAMTFAVTTAGLVVVHMLFEMWPIEKLAGKTKQPLRGLIATVYILTLAYVLREFFVSVLGWDAVEYMVRVPVCMIFGTFLVNNMMQFSLFNQMAQPVRGLVLLMLAIVIAVIMYELYVFASTLHAGHELASGLKGGYQQELWIASAMLGVTFPVIFVVSGFFAFWPLQRNSLKKD